MDVMIAGTLEYKTMGWALKTACAITCLAWLPGCGPAGKQATPDISIEGIDFVFVPGGSFLPGNPLEDQPAESRTGDMLMGRFPVTVGQYQRYLDDAPPAHKIDEHSPTGASSLPVTDVSRADARAFARWLSGRTGRAVRLPSETEWEYAARAGLHQAPYPWGWGSPDGRAHWKANGVTAVGRYPPNAYGLHDMSGLVHEWCEPTGYVPQNLAVVRGGAWSERDEEMLKVYARTFVPPDYKGSDTGFRLLVEP